MRWVETESYLFSLYRLAQLLFPPSGLATSHMLHNYGKLNFACTSDTAAAALPYQYLCIDWRRSFWNLSCHYPYHFSNNQNLNTNKLLLNVTLYKSMAYILFTMNMIYCNFRGNNLHFLSSKLRKHLYLICSNLKKNDYWQVCYPFIEFLSFITQQGETSLCYLARITAAAPLKALLNTVCVHIYFYWVHSFSGFTCYVTTTCRRHLR